MTIFKRKNDISYGKNAQMKIVESRNHFIVEGVTGIGQFSLTTGAFLAGFINLLGGSDEINGFVAVIPAIAGFFQLFAPMLFEIGQGRKKRIVSVVTVFRILLSLVYFVPFILYFTGAGLPVFIGMYFVAYLLNGLLAPALSNWMINLTPIEIRGSYLAGRERLGLIVTAVLTIILGKVLDITTDAALPFYGFMIVGVVVALFGVFNIRAVSKAEDVNIDENPKKVPLKEVIKTPFSNRTFRFVIVFFIIWNFALQVGGPFISVYMVTKLKLSYTYMMSLSVFATVVRVLVSKYWGKLADQKSWFLVTKLSIALLAVDHFLWGFVNLANYACLIPFLHFLGGIAWAGCGISTFNLQFMFAKKEGRTMYIGVNAAIGGLFSLIAVQIGGKIIASVGENSVKVMGYPFTNMHLVFMLSGLLLALCPLMVVLFLEPRKHEVEVE